MHYTAAEKTATQDVLTNLVATLRSNFRNLTPDERRKYGSINEQNKHIVNKALDYRNIQPALSSADADWVAFQNDFDSRNFIEATVVRLQNIIG